MKSFEPKNDYQGRIGGPTEIDAQPDSTRREAIGQIGKFAAYTAPAMLAMLTGEARAQGISTT